MYLSAKEAAHRLGVTRATLYAYVSRGLIRSRSTAGSRVREYASADVEAMLQRRRVRRDPSRAAAEALGVHGLPVLDSALCRIADGRLSYRGHDVERLAADRTLEDVAEILWDAPLPDVDPVVPPVASDLPPIEAMITHLATAGAADPAAFNLEAPMVRTAGARILAGLTQTVSGHGSKPVARSLMRAWKPRAREARRRIEAALILCAEHGLNVSAFTARCVASAGATPYMAVSAALAALSGHRHGRHTERVADMIDEPGTPHDVIARKLRRGESVPGIGHPLYPDGDPRARILLELAVDGPAADRGHAFARATIELLGRPPSLDLGLVVFSRSLRLPPNAPLQLFALGRTVGWVGHVLEQYASPTLIRPRAHYVGP